MNTVNITAIVLAVLAFLWTIYVAFWAGERYMKWYVRDLGEGNYDLNRFKRIHVPFLFIATVCFLWYGLSIKWYIPLAIILIAMFVQLYLISKFGKKPE